MRSVQVTIPTRVCPFTTGRRRMPFSFITARASWMELFGPTVTTGEVMRSRTSIAHPPSIRPLLRYGGRRGAGIGCRPDFALGRIGSGMAERAVRSGFPPEHRAKTLAARGGGGQGSGRAVTNPPGAMREVDVVLRDGRTVRVRPVRPEDEARYLAFLRALSEESRAMRYFVPTSETFLAEEARRETHVDYEQRFGLVATTGVEERIVGHAIFARRDGDRAEVAVAVADEYQGKGIGTILVGSLAEPAAARGIRVFEAEVMPANHRMVQLFRESGFPLEVNVKAGELHVRFPTLVTDEARAVFEQRERVASINALHPFFQPRAVAVIGASRERGTIGGELFHNLLSYGFNGPFYPVNPTAPVIQSVPAYPSVEAISGPVDLAFIAVPAAHVNDVARQCARKGVRALVVISAGFAETGGEGRTRQAELVRICRAAGMRLIGPNCMGIVNTDPAVRLNGTFVPFTAEEGRIGFFSQSGALGAAIIDYTNALGLGLSTFVSVGNKADISGNDLISYWESDPRTGVILLYLESFGNPRKFSRIAQRAGRSKPIAAVKSGQSPAGARATSSHTGALVAASDITVDALFHQAGVIRTDTLEELFDVALLLINQPAPRGKRVGIITNGGGPGILCADACAAEGLEVPVLGEATQARLRTVLPPAASVTNPVDMVAAATADHYREVLRIVGADPAVDAVIVIFIPPLAVKTEDVAQAIVVAARDLAGSKPILSVFLAARGVPAALREADLHIPSFAFPEDAAIALARGARYGGGRGGGGGDRGGSPAAGRRLAPARGGPGPPLLLRPAAGAAAHRAEPGGRGRGGRGDRRGGGGGGGSPRER